MKEIKKKIEEAWKVASKIGGQDGWAIRKMIESLKDEKITKGRVETVLNNLKDPDFIKTPQEIIDLLEEIQKILEEGKQNKILGYFQNESSGYFSL